MNLESFLLAVVVGFWLAVALLVYVIYALVGKN